MRGAPFAATCGLAALASACGPRLDLGSDVLWSSELEGNTFDEWTGDGAGAAWAYPTPPNLIELTSERVRRGAYAAKLTTDAPTGGGQGSAVLSRSGDAPPPAPTTAPGTTCRARSPSTCTG